MRVECVLEAVQEERVVQVNLALFGLAPDDSFSKDGPG